MADNKNFVEESAAYLEFNDVYYILHDLQKNLIKDQPENPIKYMIDRLEATSPLQLSVVGAPGTDRAKYSAEVAAAFDLTHIDVEALMKVQYPGESSTNLLTMDEECIACAKKALAGASAKGHVLSGFPSTKVQVRALQDLKVLTDKFVVLKGDPDKVRDALLAETDDLALEDEKKFDLVETRLQRYYRHVQGTTEALRNVALEVEVEDGANTVLGRVQASVATKVGDPRGPPRVCVVGPLGSGRSTQAALTAEAFGAVHINVNAMCGDQPAELFSDEALCKLLGDRMRQTDCLQKGWVLDGFPNTVQQAEYLKKAHLWPSRVVHLSISESVCLQRLGQRRVDPVSGEYYYGNPPTVAIRQRLVQASSDTPEHVSERYHFHFDRIKDVLGCFNGLHTIVKANQDPATLQAAIQDYVRTPLTAGSPAGGDAVEGA